MLVEPPKEHLAATHISSWKERFQTDRGEATEVPTTSRHPGCQAMAHPFLSLDGCCLEGVAYAHC